MPTSQFIACLAVLTAFEAEGGNVFDPWANAQLGVEGFPDCRRRHPAIELDPYNAGRDLECPPKFAPADAVRIACVGDSITAGAHASAREYTYPAQLQTLLDDTHGPGKFSVQNLGASGTTVEVDSESPYVRTPQFKALSKGNWDVIVLMLGTNDAKVLKPGCDTGATVETCPFLSDYMALIRFCAKLGKAHRPPSIYVAIPPPLMESYYSGILAKIVNSVYPNIFPALLNSPLVNGLIDIYTEMGGSTMWKSVFPSDPGCTIDSKLRSCLWYCDAQSCDQCHPNDYGNKHLAVRIGSALKEHQGGFVFARELDLSPSKRQLRISDETTLV